MAASTTFLDTDSGYKWQFFGETLHSAVLEGYYPKLILHDMGSHITLPGHRGKTIYVAQWKRVNPVKELFVNDNYRDFDGVGDTAETDFPVSDTMEMQNYSGSIQAFGGSFGFTDTHANITEVTGELVEGSRQLGAGYAEKVTDNTLRQIYDGLNDADANVRAAKMGSGGTTYGATTNTDYMTLTDISKVRAWFESDASGYVPAFPDGNYRGIIHPNVRHDLFVDAAAASYSLIDWLQTSRGQGMYSGVKIPVIHEIALNISAFDTTDPYFGHTAFDGDRSYAAYGVNGDEPFPTAGTHGYMSLFFAPGAFANLSLANATPSLIIQPFGSGGTKDPLKREMTIGIKGYQTCILQDMAKRCVLMSTASSLATSAV